jgi:hypothetical protein
MTDRSKTTPAFNEHQVAELAKRAISTEQALAAGVVPVQTDADRVEGMPDYWTEANGYLPGLLYPWRSVTPDTEVQYQLKPDVPQVDAEGNPRKYVFAKGFRPVLHTARVVEGSDKVLVVEGTHQALAAALYAPAGWSVYGIAGCRGWSTEGLPINDLLSLMDATVVVILDADITKNLAVYEAGQALAAELEMSGAVSVKFAQVTGGAKAGLDDVLGGRPTEHRAGYLQRLVDPARTVPASGVKRPSRDATRDAERAAAAQRRTEVEEAERAREEAEGRRRLDVSGDRLQVVNDLVAEMKRWGDERGLFNRGDMLVRRHRDTLSPLTRGTLTDVITQSVRCGQPGVTGAWSDGWPDGATMDNVLARWRDFAPLEQVVAAPFVRLDGTVCQTNGYDRQSKTFVRMAAGMAERLEVPEEPTGEDVRRAVKLLLDDWLVDFPFPTQADRAHALALMLTPFIRGQVDVVPIAVIDGNGPSAGKGLLAELFTRLVLGTPFEPTTLPDDNEEMRKAITSALLDGSALLMWDEAHVLEGTSLAQLLTAPIWRDRKLGGNDVARVPNRLTFAALGNNVRVNGDVGRRAYRIRIHPQMEHPENRPASAFRHPDIKGWTEEHRAELLSAVLVLIRAWHLAGRPSGPDTFGSFEKWSRMVGGILEHAGVAGFLDGLSEWRDSTNATVDAWAGHLEWLAESFKGAQFKTSDVAERLARAGAAAMLPSTDRTMASPEATASYGQKLGMVYHHRQGQTYGGLTLVRVGKRQGYVVWAVERQDPDSDKTDIGTFTPPTSGNQDKTDIGGMTSVTSGKKGGLGEARGASTPLRDGRAAAGEIRRAAHIGGVGVALPLASPSPTQAPVAPRSPQVVPERQEGAANPDQYLTAEPYVSVCDEGHEEVLVDGLWFACPVCHPATARVDPGA